MGMCQNDLEGENGKYDNPTCTPPSTDPEPRIKVAGTLPTALHAYYGGRRKLTAYLNPRQCRSWNSMYTKCCKLTIHKNYKVPSQDGSIICTTHLPPCNESSFEDILRTSDHNHAGNSKAVTHLHVGKHVFKSPPVAYLPRIP